MVQEAGIHGIRGDRMQGRISHSHSQQIPAEKSMLQVVERPSAAESKIPNQKAEEQPLYSNIDGKEAQWQLDAMRDKANGSLSGHERGRIFHYLLPNTDLIGKNSPGEVRH